MPLCRVAGILAHPTSFPSPFGIGDLGPAAFRFVDWMARAGQKVWQVLPLGPTDQHGSPYYSPSAFAGNPLLISPDKLADEGLLDRHELEPAKISTADDALPVDFTKVAACKRQLLKKAYANFERSGHASQLYAGFAEFCRQHAIWLDRYAMFMALSEANQTMCWTRWTEYVTSTGQPVRDSDDPARDARASLAHQIDVHRFGQFLFFRQWRALHDHARSRGICIIGDIPIYVAHKSADVWADRKLFELDRLGCPVHVAGVPPDCFSSTGQLWRNPLYDWKAMRLQGYAWWIQRMRTVLALVDIARLDHFRGLQAFWAVPARDETAVNGQWVPGPGASLLAALQQDWAKWGRPAPFLDGELPIIAEDLGTITPEVTELRDRFGLPGMSVLQFGLGRVGEDQFLSENVTPNSVIYTGTHDNDTTVGWFRNEIQNDPEALKHVRRYVRGDPDNIAWDMIELAWRTPAQIAISPLQDVLSLGSEGRMNTPGQIIGNWSWRFSGTTLTGEIQLRLAELTRRSGRADPAFDGPISVSAVPQKRRQKASIRK